MGWELISSYEYIWIVFGVFSFFIHVLSLYVIFQAKMKKSEKFFKGPFFTIVLIQNNVQGTHECLIFLTINVLNRCRKYRIIYYELLSDSILYEWEWYWFIFLRMLLYFGHVQIASNRFTAFFAQNLKTYDKVWSNWTILLLTIMGYLIAAGLRFVIYSPKIQFTTNIEEATGLFGATFDTYYDSTCDITLSIGCAAICALLYICCAYRARHLKLPLHTKKHELTMLWCGFLTFIVVTPSAIRSAIDLIASINKWEDLRRLVSRANSYPTEAMAVFQPWMLLLSCPSLRLGFWELITCKTNVRIWVKSVSTSANT